jgi:hypothetical protein
MIKMKKIGIITYFYYYNYGTMLQGYALQKVMERLGNGEYSSEIIDCRFGEKNLSFWYYFKIRVRRFFIYFTQIKRVIAVFKKRDLTNAKYKNENAQKQRLFDDFVRECCTMSEQTYNQSRDLYPNPPLYDIYVTGSDQTWSPKVGLRDSLFLGFAPKNKVKAAYAPSIGVAAYSPEEEQYVREHLKDYQFVSCREKHGAEILQNLSLVSVETVLDPTLLMRAEEWRRIAVKPETPEKYILCYFIGERTYYRDFAKQLSCQLELPLVYIPGSNTDMTSENNLVWRSGPREFLGLIDNAEVVLTDSFHGTIFSINFGKNFYSFIKHEGAKAMDNMRIIDILGRLGLAERLMTEYSDGLIDYHPIDYTTTNGLLQAERDSSETFINKILVSVQ